jgi:hypothetical protein
MYVDVNAWFDPFPLSTRSGIIIAASLSKQINHEPNFTSPDLHSLGEPFTEDEVKEAIKQMPGDKVPGRTALPATSSRDVGAPLEWT